MIDIAPFVIRRVFGHHNGARKYVDVIVFLGQIATVDFQPEIQGLKAIINMKSIFRLHPNVIQLPRFTVSLEKIIVG